jgi:hypothetical protein
MLFIFLCLHRHNDFPNSLRKYANNQIDDLDIYDLTTLEPWASSPSSHTDINRLRQGKVGAQVQFQETINMLIGQWAPLLRRFFFYLPPSNSFGLPTSHAPPSTRTPS